MTIFKFPGGSDATLAQVGGKGLSLIKSNNAGLPVPPGFVLAVDFFQPWLEALKTTVAWSAFASAGADDMAAACAALKKASDDFVFNEKQASAIESELKNFASNALFAVRSSSPEEDLEGASFAGGYETILGVNKAKMEEAVLRAFASCLDFRVAAYKKEHGFDASSPKIAVVIQQQIASEVAGVGFSINPLTNNFDEIVINANFGLGETVVAGLATPDTFRVDKIGRKVSGHELGGKETSIWLENDGGTIEKTAPSPSDFTLNDEQVLRLADLIEKVEKLYDKPIDTEWALAEGTFYLLQARPITAFVPLAPNMLTEIGETKRLYVDVTIVVQGLYKPLSTMGIDIIRRLFHAASEEVFGTDLLKEPKQSPIILQNGRLYLNASIVLAVAGQEKFAKAMASMDPTTSRAIAECDPAEYVTKGDRVHPLPWHLLMQLPELATHIIEARLLPELAHKNAARAIKTFMTELHDQVQGEAPAWKIVDSILVRTFKFILAQSIPLFVASRTALSKLQGIARDAAVNDETLLSKLERALPNNVTTEMGLSLYHLSELDPDSKAFNVAWESFIELYGHRGSEELDIAAPRYRDEPRLLMEQIETLRRSANVEDNPQQRFEKAQMERHEAFETVAETVQHKLGWLQTKRFQSLYKVFETLAGYREVHKYLLIYAIDLLRERLLDNGKTLVKAGRLDDVQQIFDLTLENLKAADTDNNVDLKSLGVSNRQFADRLGAVSVLPSIFDSRGRILRPKPVPPKPGEIAGTPISPGVIRGRIKVLHSADEKPLLRGEILVARATDPGWTPLFVNAAAVILEVGGMLQHGALVAREYGLPCVSGVTNATNLWPDGTLVEIDGAAGVIRVLEKVAV
jgi:rifampicin phosphotransferase